MAVFVLMRNQAGEILLQQRARGYLSGYYDFAASGHVEAGESLQSTVVRELAEEIGVTAAPEDLKLIHIEQYLIEEAYVNFLFSLVKWQGEPRICEPEKCSDLRYFAPDALPEKCVNAVRAAQEAGFSDELTFSMTDRAEYERFMGEPFTFKAGI